MDKFSEMSHVERIAYLASKVALAKSYDSPVLTVPIPDLEILLVELEAKDKRIAELSRLLAHNIERAEKAEKRLVYSKDAISTWERKAISNFDECATMSQRIIELEAIRSDASQVFKEIGNELGCNPDNESIMMAIDALKERLKLVREQRDNELRTNSELEKRLATPVRLPDVLFIKVSGSAVPVMHAERVKERIQRAGFTVEGDE